MAKLKLHYGGWLALPTTFCRRLGLDTGTVLEAELIEGAIVLRLATGAKGMDEPEPATLESPAPIAASEPPTQPTTPKRPRGRPRKVAASPPEPVPAPIPERAPRSELRRRVALPPVPGPEPAAPVRGRRPTRAASGGGAEREERRPFRHVEVRKLGPGRGHHRPRGLSSRS
jgi:hypothetical protein